MTVPFPPPLRPKFTFIDLFAGIGGFRMALQAVGGSCVFSSEIDEAARKTYYTNFGELPFGDIRAITQDNNSDDIIQTLIPDHDILTAGFPCQPFSRAGVSARNYLGREHGFEDQESGNLFFDILRIARIKRPQVLFLENVKNLVSHDQGYTFKTIQTFIEKELGYRFHWQIINAKSLVPQKRERCYMVCFRDASSFQFPPFEEKEIPLLTILESGVSERYTISDRLWEGHQRRSAKNKARGVGFKVNLAELDKPANTLVARYYKDGKECLIPQASKNPRMLTPRECARLQGFPDDFILPEKRSDAYRKFGNSVAIPVIQKIALNIVHEVLRMKKTAIFPFNNDPEKFQFL